MKELVKKVLESGLVDKHVARMMERWGTLEPGAADLVGREKLTKEGLREFAEEIETLLDAKSEEFKETRLEVEVGDLFTLSWNSIPKSLCSKARWDSLGRLIVLKDEFPEGVIRGAQVQAVGEEEELYVVLDIEEIYQGEAVVAYQLTVEGS